MDLRFSRLLSRLAFPLGVVSGVGAFASCTTVEETNEPSSSVDNLIGGQEAKRMGQFPGLLFGSRPLRTLALLKGTYDCSYLRVGDAMLLTALHCVTNEKGNDLALNETWKNVSTVTVFNQTQVSNLQSGGVVLKVAEIISHPVVNERSAEGTKSVPEIDLFRFPDVALIRVTPDSAKLLTKAKVAVATIRLTPPFLEDSVLLTGYGCEISATSKSPDKFRKQLKFGPSRLLSLNALTNPQQRINVYGNTYFFDETFLRQAASGYLFAAPALSSPDAAAVCEGDSGSPMYVQTPSAAAKGETASVVGLVSAGLPARAENGQLIDLSFYTRLDTQSEFDIGTWLAKSGGVKTTEGTPTDHYDNCLVASTRRSVCGKIRGAYKQNTNAFGEPKEEARYRNVFVRDEQGKLLKAFRVWAQQFEKTLYLDNVSPALPLYPGGLPSKASSLSPGTQDDIAAGQVQVENGSDSPTPTPITIASGLPSSPAL